MDSVSVRFAEARSAALAEERDTHAVGTLGEKPVHRTLKYFIDNDPAHHEVKHLGYVCDVKNEQGIFEIQTRAFDRLCPKLEKMLLDSRVTVIYPIIKERTLNWLSPENGELISSRKVSKKGKISDALPELSKIKKYLGHENLTFRIYVLSAEEYRLLDGYGAEKKRRSTKFTIVPTELFEIREFKTREELRFLLPEKLSDIFTAKEFYSAIGMKGRRAYFSLSLMLDFGFIKKVGKKGNAYIYEKT